MRILGIETSCDETAAAVVERFGGEGGRVNLLSNIVQTQLTVHAEYGGVVPELASRAHIQNISTVIQAALTKAKTEPGQLDGIAVTVGPGLIGGLLVGLSAAKGMALATGKPLIGVHHMEGHLMSPFLAENSEEEGMDFPFIALLVSGGHTLLLHARQFGDYILLGQTRDDAVGEAFDKGARMMGLGYPGGPAISKLAEQGDREAIRFPRILLDKTQLDFSFSGLKTALRTYLIKNPLAQKDETFRQHVAASYQEAIVETLTIKAIKACQQTNCPRLLVAGGVGANRRLRTLLTQRAAGKIQVSFPALNLCTDNGAMIALAGMERLQRGGRSGWELNAQARWPVMQIPPMGSIQPIQAPAQPPLGQ
ncbi:MAG: tRNA (adenosine(37)-N6)-threonylcarbamoyltransferase complex transferase subunit TsaD [Magnetococcales bacterium]|nr:tRNA (adenosine(37)-N6)-threonylcarbamoyltransferase complex transferase subunit TsaD [Magnetococcales bacterium]